MHSINSKNYLKTEKPFLDLISDDSILKRGMRNLALAGKFDDYNRIEKARDRQRDQDKSIHTFIA